MRVHAEQARRQVAIESTLSREERHMLRLQRQAQMQAAAAAEEQEAAAAAAQLEQQQQQQHPPRPVHFGRGRPKKVTQEKGRRRTYSLGWAPFETECPVATSLRTLKTKRQSQMAMLIGVAHGRIPVREQHKLRSLPLPKESSGAGASWRAAGAAAAAGGDPQQVMVTRSGRVLQTPAGPSSSSGGTPQPPQHQHQQAGAAAAAQQQQQYYPGQGLRSGGSSGGWGQEDDSAMDVQMAEARRQQEQYMTVRAEVVVAHSIGLHTHAKAGCWGCGVLLFACYTRDSHSVLANSYILLYW